MTDPIRPATTADVEAIQQIAVDTEMFGADDIGFFDEMVGEALDGTRPDDRWLVVEDGADVIAAAYYAPEPFADRLWNLYFISVAPDHQGRGVGGRLMDHVEAQLRAAGDAVARVLVVETSSTEQYARTRAFYRRRGYDEEATIREFYGPGDHKVVYWRSLGR